MFDSKLLDEIAEVPVGADDRLGLKGKLLYHSEEFLCTFTKETVWPSVQKIAVLANT